MADICSLGVLRPTRGLRNDNVKKYRWHRISHSRGRCGHTFVLYPRPPVGVTPITWRVNWSGSWPRPLFDLADRGSWPAAALVAGAKPGRRCWMSIEEDALRLQRAEVRSDQPVKIEISASVTGGLQRPKRAQGRDISDAQRVHRTGVPRANLRAAFDGHGLNRSFSPRCTRAG